MNSEKYIITVSEPWNYSNPEGENIITGNLIRIIDNDCVLFKADQIVNINDVNGDVLLLFSRYEKTGFDSIKKERRWTVGGSILYISHYQDLDRKALEANSKYVLIGSIEEDKY